MVLRALENAVGSQNTLQLGAMKASNETQGEMQMINSDLGSQSTKLDNLANQLQTGNTAATIVSTILGVAMTLSIGLSAVGGLGFASSTLEMAQPLAEGMTGGLGVTRGALQINNGVLRDNLQQSLAQSGLDSATTKLTSSTEKTISGAVEDGSKATTLVGQKTAEAIQAYGRAQRGK